MAEIVWASDAQMSGFTIMSNGMVWPDDWPGTLVEAQFTSARGDGADLDRDPDMVPSGPGRVTFTPQVRTVGYDGEHGKRIVSLHPFEAVVGDDGFLYTPDEYWQPGIRGIVLPSNNSDVVDEHDWTWRVTFDIPDTTIRPTHIPTPHEHSVDIKDYLDSDANHGVRVVVDRVAARETLTARDETIAARDLVLPARDQTLAARDQTLAHGITVDTSVGIAIYMGDTLVFYDTGWRDVTAEATATILSGRILIKRTATEVYIVMDDVIIDGSGTNTYIRLPFGFRPEYSQQGFWNQYLNSSLLGDYMANANGYVVFYSVPNDTTTPTNLTVGIPAPSTLPTSLPGTPA